MFVENSAPGTNVPDHGNLRYGQEEDPEPTETLTYKKNPTDFNHKQVYLVLVSGFETGSACAGLEETSVDNSAPGETVLHDGDSGTGQEEDPEPGEADRRG